MNYQERECEMIDVPPDIAAKAREGDAKAQLVLGKLYFEATLVENNLSIAFGWIYRSAKQGEMEAQFTLGDLYALGYGISKSLSDAYQWYTRAAIQGYKKALIRIHNLYQEDTRMHCRGQINSDEEKWTSDEFKMSNNVRELYEYRLKKKKAILNGAIDYYARQFKQYQSSNQDDYAVQLNLAFLYQHGYGVKKCTRWAMDYYTIAAKKGSIDAQYNLGDLYQKHTHIKFNYRHAFKWFTEAAQGGSIAAQKYLAYFYLKGLATDIDYTVALFWYSKAAEAGDSGAQVILGKLYRKGDYVEQDLTMAVKWYSLAARQNSITAQNCLTHLNQRGMLNDIDLGEDVAEYFTEGSINKRICTKLSMDILKLGDSPNFKQQSDLARRALIGDGQAMYEIGLKYYYGGSELTQNQDKDTGIKWIKNAASANHKVSQLMMADLYKRGDSIEQDYHKAALQYKALAKQKDANGQCNVGIMYDEGLGVRGDPLEASRWFTWAAEQGNSNGWFNLGMLIYRGRGLRKDRTQGIQLLYQAVCMKNLNACYTLGYVYFNGIFSVKEDKKTALRLWDFAARNGDIQVQLDLADKYKEGAEIQQSVEKYIEYISMAVDCGSAKAQYHLAIAYLHGYGVQQDYIKAYTLFKKASDKGYMFAKWMFQTPFMHDYDTGDISKVIDMLLKVTEKGIDDLRFNIGFIYEYGVRLGPAYVQVIDYAKAKKWYLAASKNGDARADYRLGIMYELGRGVKKSLKTAIKYYKRAAVKEDKNAICRLAYMYFNGHSNISYSFLCVHFNGYHVAQDLLSAFSLYTTASAMGHEGATKALAVLGSYRKSNANLEISLENDLLIPFNTKKQLSMLERATEEGLTRLQYQIGVMYENDNDYSKAIKWYSLAAEIGVTDAYYRLGVFYEEGRGIERDYKMAAKMYYKATEKDHEDACYRLAQLYQYGNGVKLDYPKAYRFYKRTADMGHTKAYRVLNITLDTNINSSEDKEVTFFDPTSQEYNNSLLMCKNVAELGDTDMQFKVGFAYEYSFLEPDYEEASYWYSLAANNSHKNALYHLGLLYENGLGVSQDYQKANQLYQQASLLNSDGALYQLGVAHHHGNGVEFDPKKALKYYTISAELGNPKYQIELGRLYEEGVLDHKSLLEALKWYSKAYIQGYDTIKSKLDTMDIYKPYETTFFERLFRNLSVASHGYFRLNEDYEYNVYSGVNYRLGSLYAFGQGTTKDLAMAWKYFSKKYDNFHGALIENFLFLKYKGLGSSQKNDLLKILEEDKAFMGQINTEEHYTLGMIFFDGIVHTLTIGRDNIKKGYTPIDDQDKDDPSQYIVIEKDYSRAYRCLKEAAWKNHPGALLQLGIMYHCGYGVEQNSKQGEKYFDSATIHDIGFTGRIAILYHTYEGLQDFKKAFEWYKRLEKRLDNDLDEINRVSINQQVQWGLGLLYEYGDGVEQDYLQALECYTRLADENINIGMHRLALMYYYGRGVSIDYVKSFKLFKEATIAGAWRGEKLVVVYDQDNFGVDGSQNNRIYCTRDYHIINGESFYYLGLMHEEGKGTQRDKYMAQFYFGEAFKQGCKRAECKIES